MDLSSQMILFARVAKAGSFSAAARTLDLTPSAVSRQIGHLEDRVGVRLVNRSNHGLVITEEGQAFLQRCVEISDRVFEAETFASAMNGHPRGRLKLVSTVAFGKSQLLPVIPAFLARYGDVTVSLELTDRKVDLFEEDVDLAIRFSEQVEDDRVIARKLARNRRLICAAPAYLDRYGTPTRLTELETHNCLQLSTVNSWNDWRISDPKNGRTVSLNGNVEVNSADGIYHAALAGAGIARLSTYLINDDIRTGRLVHLFPDYEDDRSDIVAIYSEKKNLSPKIRAFIDHMVAIIGLVPPWERAPCEPFANVRNSVVNG
ncbi:MAG: LysR family transcriptional regulator [Alphaproteobacteria bacterium]|nr:LysR family transcriptional regulator [Alphaproteobacteria bacterium]